VSRICWIGTLVLFGEGRVSVGGIHIHAFTHTRIHASNISEKFSHRSEKKYVTWHISKSWLNVAKRNYGGTASTKEQGWNKLAIYQRTEELLKASGLVGVLGIWGAGLTPNFR